MNSFSEGFSCFAKGLDHFFHSKGLWKYSLLPLFITIVCYILLLSLLIWGGSFLETWLHGAISTLPSWCAFLKYIYSIFHYLFLLLLGAVLVFFTIPPLYELFHGLFSDALLEKWGKENGLPVFPHTFRDNWIFFLQNLKFSLQTLLFSILLFPLSFFIPFIGGLLFWCFLAYRLGLSLVFPASFLGGKGVRETLEITGKYRGLVLGFGLAASLSLMIPFLFPLFLPGMTLGGALVCRKMEEAEKPN